MAEKAITLNGKKTGFCDECLSTMLIDISKQVEKQGKAIVVKYGDAGAGVVLGRNTCQRCEHVWTQRLLELPTICPKCKNPYWNKPRVKS